MSNERKIISANEFQLVDAEGGVRASLSASDTGVAFSMLNANGRTNLQLMVDNSGFSALKLFDSETQAAKVDVSLDDKGSHLYLAGMGKQQSYLFLKNDGASGVVLMDKNGDRRVEVMLDPSGKPRVKIQPPGEDPREV